MSLEQYHHKRDFNKTKEPKGKISQGNKHLFIIQKHAASHLHYDFRIELNGVLKSWAVPKGPCLDPQVKRLAIHVEDHPIEYGSFEGIIPKGQYGGGTVLLWDKGYWEPLDKSPEQAYRKGHLRFELHAKKLKGRWDLVRFKPNGKEWFLIKYRDDYAQSFDDYDIIQEEPNSVLSDKNIEVLSEDYQLIWTKQGAKKAKKEAEFSANHPHFKIENLDLPIGPFLTALSAQLATKVDTPPLDENWLHEIKFDGYRILAFKKGKNITLLSRNHKDWTIPFAIIAEELKKIPLKNVILDGEVVLLDKENRSSFQLLQNSMEQNKNSFYIYYVFDLLYYEKWDIRSLALTKRKALLASSISGVSPHILYSDHIIGQGKQVFTRACQFALEGIISKQINSSYTGKRSNSWLKVKCAMRQEFVIGGYSNPEGSRHYFGSLYLGYYDKHKNLIFCGKVGTGFTDESLKMIYGELTKLRSQKNPFSTNPPGVKSAHWLKPQLVAEVAFSEWTGDGRLRHPSFQGLRSDKKAQDVIKETSQLTEKIINPSIETSAASLHLKISNPHKILYPEDKVTKQEICEYYSNYASYILPYISNRPLTLVRCPSNYKACFYQKHFNRSSSHALETIPIQSKHDLTTEDYIYIKDVTGLVGLVQMGVLEIHPWGSQISHLEQPDIITIDLDPAPEVEWKAVVKAAFEVKNNLAALHLESFVKTTGGKGLHVVIPIQPQHDWKIIKQFTQLLVAFLEKQYPNLYVTNMAKAKRKNKIFLDYLRNQRGATAIAPYSTRARVQAPIATPLAWGELTADIRDTFYTIRTIQHRFKHLKTDPWEHFWCIKQSLQLNGTP